MTRTTEKQVRKWDVTRAKHVHFTDDELMFIRKCCREGRRAFLVAQELKCSIRSVNVHYARLKNGY